MEVVLVVRFSGRQIPCKRKLLLNIIIYNLA